MLMEDHLLEKGYDKKLKKVSMIEEELENPSLARTRLEIVREFVTKKSEDLEAQAKKNQLENARKKLNSVEMQFVRESLRIEKENFDPDREMNLVF